MNMIIYMLRGLFIVVKYIPLFCAFFILELFLMKKKSKKQMAMNAGLVLYLAALINITGLLELRLSIAEILSDRYVLPNLIPFVHMNIEQGLMNILLFFPLGFLLPNTFIKNKWSIYSIAISCLVVTFTIELLQFFGGRCFDIDDMIMNIIGGLLGYIFADWKSKRKEEGKADNTSLTVL